MSAGDLWDALGPAEPIRLYDWQAEAVERLRENIRGGKRNQILAAPTGSGKTTIAAFLVEECLRKGKRAVFVVDRIPLVDQTSATFDGFGIPHGVIQATHWRYRPEELIQVASAPTLARRSWPHDLALIIVDEAHTVYKSVVQRIAQRDCVTIGLTATPFTAGLGQHYDAVATVRTTDQLIEEKLLAPFRVYAPVRADGTPAEPDMTGAPVTKLGEWEEGETERRAMPIVGDIVTEYLRHAEGKKFIAFGVSVAHCEEIQRQMMAAGVMCGLYTYQTTDDERRRMLQEFAKPDSYLQGLASVAALSKGFDNPGVEVVIMARPLRRSLAEHIQILGRGLRRDPANPDKVCTVLDHAGNCVRFGARMWDFFANGATELDDGKRKERPEKKEAKEREPYKCPKCSHIHPPRPMCPMCGHEYPRRAEVEHVAGELRELSGATTATRDQKQETYSMLLHIALTRGYKTGWAYHKYRERFGVAPRGLEDVPIPPSSALMRWVRSRAIAYAKATR